MYPSGSLSTLVCLKPRKGLVRRMSNSPGRSWGHSVRQCPNWAVRAMVKEKKDVRERELMLSPKSIRRSDGHSSRDEQSANALVQEKAGFLDFTPQQLSSPNTMVWSSAMSEMVMEAMLGKLCGGNAI